MSFWTYVNCLVKIDSKEKIKDFSEIFGKEVDFNSADEVWEDAYENPYYYLPRGSEGSLNIVSKLVTRVPNSNYPYRYWVYICGSLRDFTSWQIIQNWIDSSQHILSNYEPRVLCKITLTASCDYRGTYKWEHTDYAFRDPFFYKIK